MDILPTDAAGIPQRWLIAFRRTSKSRWIRWLVPGRYKHVRAFAFVPECDAWVFYDVGWGHTQVFLARGRSARYAMLDWTRDADVLAMTPRDGARTGQLVLCCTTAIRHLLGLSGRGTLPTPTGLYNLCLRHGAEPVQADGTQAQPAADSGDRPAA